MIVLSAEADKVKRRLVLTAVLFASCQRKLAASTPESEGRPGDVFGAEPTVRKTVKGVVPPPTPQRTPVPRYKEIYRDELEKDLAWTGPRGKLGESGWARDASRSGSRSLKLVATPGEALRWRQEVAVPITPGRKYVFRVWTKRKNVMDHWGVNFRVDTDAGEGAGLGWLLGGERDWEEVHVFFTVRRSARITSFRLGLAAENDLGGNYDLGEKMTAWFDDITVEELPFRFHTQAELDAGISEKKLFELIDLSRKELSAVRKAVDARDYKAAREALVAHFRRRPRRPCHRRAAELMKKVTSSNIVDTLARVWRTCDLAAAGKSLKRIDRNDRGGGEHRPTSNHAWGEIVDTFTFVAPWREFSDYRNWTGALSERIEREIGWDQYCPDGGQHEGAPHYHQFCMRRIMDIASAARTHGVEIGPAFARMAGGPICDYYVYTMTPSLRVPIMGDVSSDHVHDSRRAAEVLGRKDALWVATARKRGAPPAAGSVAFDSSGFYVMRTGWGPEAHYMLFRCIDHRGYWQWHWHRDQLSFLLYAYGKGLVLERGDWGPMGHKGDDYRLTAYHNSMQVDGREHNWFEAKCRAWYTSSELDYVHGFHQAYAGAGCRRRVFFVRAGDDPYWVLADTVEGEGVRTVKQRLHLGPPTRVETSPDREIIYGLPVRGLAQDAPDRSNTRIVTVPEEETPGASLAVLLVGSRGEAIDWKEEEGLVSFVGSDGGARNPSNRNIKSPLITWERRGRLPMGCFQVLYPFEGPTRRPENLKVRVIRPGCLAVRRGTREDYFFSCETPQTATKRAVRFSGESLFVRTDGGKPEIVAALRCAEFSSLEMGLRIGSRPPASFVLKRTESGWEVSDVEAQAGTEIRLEAGEERMLFRVEADGTTSTVLPSKMKQEG